MLSEKFPKIKKKLSDFLYEEEGNIPRSTMLTIGTMALILSVFYFNDIFDDDFSTHYSHDSHDSHYSHDSHDSHWSHDSHYSHSSHFNEHMSDYIDF